MKIFKDSTIFGVPTWMCFHSYYLYTGETLFQLIKQMLFEWNNDKHMIG